MLGFMSARRQAVATATLALAPQPVGARIRADLERNIVSGRWAPGTRIPFEHELVAQYGCSRMTVSKVLSALVVSGLIVRRRKAGSFVAMPRTERAPLEIQDFADEAARLGLSYRHEILHRAVETLDGAAARAAGLRRAGDILRVHCLHHIGEVPVAYEERFISLARVPRARDETFEVTPPATWLLRSVPWTEAQHVIRARSADAELVELLCIAPGTACLVLERRTWLLGALVTEVSITYPGDRHEFVGRFSPVAA
jgi:GntR family transcriptional regulator, histidine utilization repressor